MSKANLPKVHELRFIPGESIIGKPQNEEINNILDEGYEIKDIIPCYDRYSSFFNNTVFGVAVKYAMIIFMPSDKKTSLTVCSLKNDKDACDKINEIIAEEAEKGSIFIKLIPINSFMDKRSTVSSKGTSGYVLFFIKEK